MASADDKEKGGCEKTPSLVRAVDGIKWGKEEVKEWEGGGC